jgi:hypothetical protein
MKVSELRGPLLDYWVARAEGKEARITHEGAEWLAASGKPWGGANRGHSSSSPSNWAEGTPLMGDGGDYWCAVDKTFKTWSIWYSFSPSTCWAEGGPILERERILPVPRPDGGWSAILTNSDVGWGDTLLEAVMRCYVMSKFGDEVSDEGF